MKPIERDLNKNKTPFSERGTALRTASVKIETETTDAVKQRGLKTQSADERGAATIAAHENAQKKAVVFTLGCKTNRYESDAIAAELNAGGFTVSDAMEKADVYVLNTCAVTAEAERKSRQAIARIRAKNPAAAIFVCGCASEKSAADYEKEGVKLVLGTAAKQSLASRIAAMFCGNGTENDCGQSVGEEENTVAEEGDRTNLIRTNTVAANEYEEFSAPPAVNRTRTELKIQDGCNEFCSYCIIPYLRGRSRSRQVANVVREAEYLDGKTREIVLTGINLSRYGADIGTDLAGLLGRLQGVETRIRLGSFYVEGVTDALIAALKKLKNFCPQFHLSLQSGDDTVLRAMNRKYGTGDYRAAVEKIRAAFPNAGITTDVITGYPAETDEAAANTLRFLQETGFSDLHVFVFSRREGTAAYRLKELPSAVITKRKNDLLRLKSQLKQAFLIKNLGVPQEVLIEEEKDGEYVGYSKNYIRVYTDDPNPNGAVVPKILYKDGVK